VTYTGVFPAVEPPSAAGIFNLLVAISSEICSSFALGTLEDAGGAEGGEAPPASSFPLDRGSAHGRRQPRSSGELGKGGRWRSIGVRVKNPAPINTYRFIVDKANPYG
jgi:hypothetical protein